MTPGSPSGAVDPAATSPRPPTIQARLTRLILGWFIVLFVATLVLVTQAYQYKRTLIEQHMVETAHALTLAVDRDIARLQTGLQVLATSPHLATGDFRAFHAQAREVLRDFPGADIILADETAQQLVNSYREYGEPLPKRGNRLVVRKIFETGAPLVTDVFTGAVTKRPLIGVDVPVRVNGKVTYDLAMTLPADRLNETLAQQRLPPGWVGSVLDSSRVIAARTAQPEVFVGRVVGSDLMARLNATPEGVVAVRNLEGVEVLDAFSQSEVSGWTVVIGVPVAVVRAEVWHWLGWTLVGVVLALLASVAVAGWMARGIAHSVRALVAPAMTLGRGEPVGSMRFDLKETDDVAKALETASTLLVRRARERDEAEQALTDRNQVLQHQYDTLRSLNEIAALSQTDVATQLTEALHLGQRHLNLPIAIISRVEGPRYTVQHHAAPPDAPLTDGQAFDLGRTYCALTLAAKEVLAIDHMARSDHAGHPCYQAFGLESYIGAAITVHGRAYGTVNFSAPTPRPHPFDPADLEFMRLLARWIGSVLEGQLVHEELARSNTELEQFAYVASHDLREPLRQVSSFVSLLERRYAASLDAEAREYIGFARDGAQRMDHLILDLLEYSRIGRHERPKAPVELAEVVADALRNLSASVEPSGVTVAADLPTIRGDHIELVRLFQNLIGNAAKYHHPSRPLQVSVAAQRDNGWWVITVTDNGIGIAREHFDRIFRIFQRLHGRGQYEGTGIGLASCKKIVEHHGGRIWLNSEPGQGSTFFFTLPATEG